MEKISGTIEKYGSSEEFKTIRNKMLFRATDIIAGATIANKDFPEINVLPRFTPLPFNNFGHFYLFDHERFLTIIYDTIAGYKKISKAYKAPTWPLIVSLGVPIFLILLLILLVSRDDQNPVYYILIIISGVILYICIKPDEEKKIENKIAEYKANVICMLLNGEWARDPQVEIPERLKQYFLLIGKGNCDNKVCPVLIAFDDENPFPGYGKLLLDKQFVCKPKNIEIAKQKKDSDLFDSITTKLERSLSESGISSIGFGKVIVVNSESISIDSAWLDENKIPYLDKEISEVESLSNTDKAASTRIYFIVEVLFPKYDSAACFFVRSYKAGNSAGFHIAITTIGPPADGEQYLKDRIMRYNIENAGDDTLFDAEITLDSESIKKKELTKIRSQSKFREKFQTPISQDKLDKIDPIEEDKDYDKLKIDKIIAEIIDHDPSWPGKYYFFPNNIRERKSLTLGGDFFGYPELIGSITSAYSQIVEHMLSVIEDQGFDVSNYKDKEGNLTINADRIEKVIVGEVVNTKSDEENKESDNKTINQTIQLKKIKK